MNYIYITQQLRPKSSFTHEGNGKLYSDIKDWLDLENPQPTKEECDTAWAEGLEDQHSKKTRKTKRRSEYARQRLSQDYIEVLHEVVKVLKQQGASFSSDVSDWKESMDNILTDNPI